MKQIYYTSRRDSNYFTDFAGEHKQQDIRELAWKYDEQFIDPNLCDKFVSTITKLNKEKIKGTGLYVAPEGDDNYRKSDISFLSEKDMEIEEIRSFRDEIILKTMILNEKLFNFDISHLMHCQYTEYDGLKNGHFNWHPDGPFGIECADHVKLTKDHIFRKLSVVVCLSDHTEYEGGEFLLVDPCSLPDQSICSFKMSKGEAIIFPAFLMHRVMPVTSGQRLSLVNWFCGPRWT